MCRDAICAGSIYPCGRNLVKRTSPKIFILSAVCGIFRTRVGRYQKQTFTSSGSRIK